MLRSRDLGNCVATPSFVLFILAAVPWAQSPANLTGEQLFKILPAGRQPDLPDILLRAP